jgi:hypothetical protein
MRIGHDKSVRIKDDARPGSTLSRYTAIVSLNRVKTSRYHLNNRRADVLGSFCSEVLILSSLTLSRRGKSCAESRPATSAGIGRNARSTQIDLRIMVYLLKASYIKRIESISLLLKSSTKFGFDEGQGQELLCCGRHRFFSLNLRRHAIASLTLEVRVCLAVKTTIAPV